MAWFGQRIRTFLVNRVVLGAVAICGLVIAGVALWNDVTDDSQPTSSPTSAPVPPPSGPPDDRRGRVLQAGQVRGLVDQQGLDLDTGVVNEADDLKGREPRKTGQDISPSARASSFGLLDGAVEFAVLPDRGPEEFHRCAEVKSWAGRPRGVEDLYDMAPGTNICFRTSWRNLAMVTIDRTPESESGSLDLRYVVWHP